MSHHRFLFFTDPHFTDREQDAYRWKLFPFLKEVEEKFGHIDLLACLGDLTEHKDCHSSALLHRILKELREAPGEMKIVVKGNHDYVDEGEPFFDWLGELRVGENIFYCSEPALYDGGILVLPHCRNPQREWETWRTLGDLDDVVRLVLTHITVDGCQSEMGTILPGIPRRMIPGSQALVLSGDIHKPQHMGPDFIYVGTPYSTRFSPAYEPRVLLLEFNDEDQLFDPKITSIPTGLKRKITQVMPMEEVERMELGVMGLEDELRVSVRIPSHFTPTQWVEFKERVLAKYPGDQISLVPLVDKKQPLPEVPLQGVGVSMNPEESLSEYCTSSAVPQPLEAVGRNLLRNRLSKT